MKERIRWSARFQHWYHVSSWVFSDRDRTALRFVLGLNEINGSRN